METRRLRQQHPVPQSRQSSSRSVWELCHLCRGTGQPLHLLGEAPSALGTKTQPSQHFAADFGVCQVLQARGASRLTQPR